MGDSKQILQTSRFSVVERSVEGPGGGALQRAVVVHPGAVVVVPRLEDGRVCLIRNHRVAVGKTLIEVPAGTREPHEPPDATARRELQEETGFRAGRLTPLPPFFMSPGILSERVHPYVATDLTAGEPQREPGEQIENLLLTWGDVIEMVRRGEIEDAKTIATLLYCHAFE